MSNTIPYNIPIDFTKYKNHLKLRVQNGQSEVWDIIRKKYLVLQPEELVRQLVVQWLIVELKISPNKLQLERQFKVNNKIKRFDIIAYNNNAHAQLLIECKSHVETINQKVFDQIAIYQSVINAPYLLVTNGIDTYLATMDIHNQRYLFEDSLVHLKKLF